MQVIQNQWFHSTLAMMQAVCSIFDMRIVLTVSTLAVLLKKTYKTC